MGIKIVINRLLEMLSCQCVEGSEEHALLEEFDPSAKIKKILLNGLKTGDLVIMMDAGRIRKCTKCKREVSYVSPFFKLEKGVLAHQLVDTVIFRLRSNGSYDCLYVDLKSTKPSGYKAQFENTQCVIRYFLDVMRTLHNTDIIIEHEQFVLIQAHRMGSSLFKLPIKKYPRRRYASDDPLRIFKKDGDQVMMNELLLR